jgi:hypothetical protein
VRGVLPDLLEALGRPIRHVCWVDPVMRGKGNTIGGVQEEHLPKRRDPVQLDATIVGEDGSSAPQRSRPGS